VTAVVVRPVLSRVTDTCTVAQAGGSDSASPRAPTVTACALRLKPDVITQLITKYEARQRKIADHLLNRGTSNKYHFAERFRGNLTEFLESAGGLDALLAVDAVVGSKDTAVGANTLALQSVLLLLRRHGIRVSDRPHQLQGASQGFQQHLEPSLAATLCAELGVPFVVILHPDAGNKITLQYCGDHATTASAAHSTQAATTAAVRAASRPPTRAAGVPSRGAQWRGQVLSVSDGTGCVNGGRGGSFAQSRVHRRF
jgi:hypothetical protein